MARKVLFASAIAAATALLTPAMLPASASIRHLPDDNYGFSVAISGPVAVVGAPGVKHGHGAVYIFTRAGTSWQHQATIPGPVATDGQFGWSVGVSSTRAGTFAIIGAPESESFNGAAYIYARSGRTWHRVATFAGPAKDSLVSLGSAVAISGSTAVIGADSLYTRNFADIVTRSGSTWRIRAKLADPGGKDKDSFGNAVAISGGTALIGAWGADRNYSGAAYVYTRGPSGGWSRQAKLTDPGEHFKDNYGWSVALSGSTAVIGAPGPGTGAAFVYARTGRMWHRRAKLAEPRAVNGNEFGMAVTIAGPRAVVGDPRQTARRCGGAFEFHQSGGSWSTAARLLNPGCKDGRWFGGSVAISGRTVLIGAPSANKFAGATYIIDVP